MGFLKVLVVWLVVALMLVTAVVVGWLTIKTHLVAAAVARRSQQDRHEDLVHRVCADLDEEYRELLRHKPQN